MIILYGPGDLTVRQVGSHSEGSVFYPWSGLCAGFGLSCSQTEGFTSAKDKGLGM